MGDHTQPDISFVVQLHHTRVIEATSYAGHPLIEAFSIKQKTAVAVGTYW
jgi:hypothetical protein